VHSDLLPKEETDSYHLFDLQFDQIGSYVANGVTVQSRHPQSFITPLPKELYFDKNLFQNEKKDDNDPNYEFPLVHSSV
jgi:hypothetical protein